MRARSTAARVARSQGGFTLIELLAAMTVLGFGVMIAWQGLISTTVKTGARVQEESTLQTEVRSVVDQLASDLRQAQCDDSTDPATPPVTTASGTQLTFYSPDRLTPYHLRQISYRLSGGELDRRFATTTNDSTTGPPWTWGSFTTWAKQIGSVTNATAFTYYDADGNATSTASDVASVNVALTIAPHAGLGGASTAYQTTVDLRTASC